MAIKSFYNGDSIPKAVTDSMVIGRNDKRDFIRMSIQSDVEFSFCDSDVKHTGKTIDLSATGIRFTTQTAVSVGQMLDLMIKPGTEITPPLTTTVAVVRVEQSEDGQTYEVAGVMRTPQTP